MRPHRRCAQFAVPAAVAVAAVLLAPLGVSAAAGASVSIVDSPPAATCSGYSYCFDPASVHVDAGGTVTWTSNSKVPHTVSADDGSFGSGDLGATQTFQHTFATSGTYTYHCNIHSFMHGTVVVGSGSAPPPTSPPAPPPTVNPRATNAPTAAPTATPRNTAAPSTPTLAPPSPTPATAAVSPTPAPLADAGGAPTASPTPGGGALPAAGTASTGGSGGGGSAAGPVLGAVAAVLAAASTALVLHRRRRSFTKIR
ncbi:MAG TPA: plastocyanin/azurin family copper-binding protein [Candidatus Angelobacter sp.]|jgi:plastocyanin|nr:plastocyanin/azurin family copper-binding protein [Candidatus Angelobacter sp.]